MEILIIAIGFLLLMGMGVPIGTTLGVAGVATLYFLDL